jgi:hypothetical protein
MRARDFATHPLHTHLEIQHWLRPAAPHAQPSLAYHGWVLPANAQVQL